MKKSGIISAIASVCLLLSSCSVEHPGTHRDIESVWIQGTVTDDTGAPIEHIKVVFNWNSSTYYDIKYTSSIGKFETHLQDNPNSDIIHLVISFEDIDGEDNGGRFEPYSETITLVKEDITEPVLRFDYRLNRATASGNSPRS